MVGVLSNKIGREELKPGDHIYSWRTAYIYSHHGIYIGDDKVIHFTPAAGREIGTGTGLDNILFSSFPTTNGSSTCQRCTDARNQHQPQSPQGGGSGSGGVIISCLDCFLDGDDLYHFAYSVTPAFFLAKTRGGTCTMAASDHPDLVMHRASFLLTHGFRDYSLFKNNCEDFAIYCKTGLLMNNVETAFSIGCSGQMASVIAAMSAVTALPLRNLASIAGGLTITAVKYCMERYMSDIRIRKDVVEVPVEKLAEHVRISAQKATPVTPVASASLDTMES